MQNFGERRFVFQEAPDPFKKASEGAGKLFDAVVKLAEKASGKRKDETTEPEPSDDEVLDQIARIGTPEWVKEQEEAVRLSKLRQVPMAELADELATPALGEAFDMVGVLNEKYREIDSTPAYITKEDPEYNDYQSFHDVVPDAVDPIEANGYWEQVKIIGRLVDQKGLNGKSFEIGGAKIRVDAPRHVIDKKLGVTKYSIDSVTIHIDSDNVKRDSYGETSPFVLSATQSGLSLAHQNGESVTDYEAANVPYPAEPGTTAVFYNKLKIVADTVLGPIEKYLESL